MRKSNTPFFFLSLSLLLISLSSLASSQSPVRDTTGQNLRTDLYYFILPAARGGYGGGGLTLSAGHNATSTCPLDVVQEQRDYGLPVTFSPVNLPNGVVRVSTDLNIVFSPRAYSVCVESNVWRLGSPDQSTGKNIVTTGGIEGFRRRRRNRRTMRLPHTNGDSGSIVQKNPNISLHLSPPPPPPLHSRHPSNPSGDGEDHRIPRSSKMGLQRTEEDHPPRSVWVQKLKLIFEEATKTFP